MENNLLELWSHVLGDRPRPVLRRRHDSRSTTRLRSRRTGDSDRLGQLRRRIRPLMLRRTKEQVATDLPEKQEQVIELELNPQHRKVYQTHLQRERQKVLGLIDDMTKNRFAIFRSLTLLRQLSLDAEPGRSAYANIPSTKLDALMEQVADIVGGRPPDAGLQPVHRIPRQGAASEWTRPGVEYCYLDGSTRNRPAVLGEFKSGYRAGFPDQPEGRRGRPEPDRGRLLHPARPVVESRRPRRRRSTGFTASARPGTSWSTDSSPRTPSRKR